MSPRARMPASFTALHGRPFSGVLGSRSTRAATPLCAGWFSCSIGFGQESERGGKRGPMRKSIFAFMVVAVLAVGASTAAAGPNGDLISSFRTELNQLKDADFDGFDRPDGFITPFVTGPLLICDELVVGTWFSLVGEDRSSLDNSSAEFRLDGELLDATRTTTKRINAADGKTWGFTNGVPVLGILDAGLHTLEYSIIDDGLGPFVFSVDLDVSSTHC